MDGHRASLRLPQPQLQSYIYAGTFTRPAAEPVSSNRYQAMIQSLEPLPEFGPFGKGQLPVQKVGVQAQQVVTLDIEGDGQLETAAFIHATFERTTLGPGK